MKLTKKEILNNVQELERKGDYHAHATPIDYSKMKKVDGKYKYVNGNIFYKFAHYFVRGLMFVFRRPIARLCASGKVEGRENIKGVNNAVVVVNHVHPLDCVLCMNALNKRHLYVTIGDFNNFDNALGGLLRAWGVLPLVPRLDAQKNFWKACSQLLNKKKTFVVVYPEASLWLYYEKVRPFMNGAFHMAVKNNVPVVPMFISFKKTGKFDKNGVEKRRACVSILKPIYPRPELSEKENINNLRETSYQMMAQKYEEVYGEKMVLPEPIKEDTEPNGNVENVRSATNVTNITN